MNEFFKLNKNIYNNYPDKYNFKFFKNMVTKSPVSDDFISFNLGNKLSTPKIVRTYGNTFTAASVFSTALLAIKFQNLKVIRYSGRLKKGDLEKGIIAYDIGGTIYDPHYPYSENETLVREDGTPYSSFGLLFEKFKNDIFLHKNTIMEDAIKEFEETFVLPVDKHDNDITKSDFCTFIELYNPAWYELKVNFSYNRKFQEVTYLVIGLMNKFITRSKMNTEAILEYLLKIKTTEIEKVVVLDAYLPWNYKEIVESELGFIIYPNSTYGFILQCIPKEYKYSNFKSYNLEDFKYPLPSSILDKKNVKVKTEQIDEINIHIVKSNGSYILVNMVEEAISIAKALINNTLEVK